MANNTGTIILVIILIVGAILIFGGNGTDEIDKDIKTKGEMTREVPSEVSGDSFEVTYSSDKEGKWGAIIVDNVSGGCQFPGGKEQYKNVLISTRGKESTSVDIDAPESGSCTFSGNYNFGSGEIKEFPDQTVNIK